MDVRLFKEVAKQLPKMDEGILNGLATEQIKSAEAYMHGVFLSASASFPKGLRYIGSVVCTPKEQFDEITRSTKPFRSYELLRSDVYMVKYLLEFNGKPIRPQYLFLPFINEADLLYLSGTQYKVTPVISGRLFNIEKGNIYMRTPRAPVGFSSHSISCIKNGCILNTAAVYSYLYNMEPAKRSLLKPTLMHYILSVYGLKETMKKMFNVNVSIGNWKLDSLNPEEWVVYRSRQELSIVKKYNAKPTDLRIAISAEEYYPLLDSIIGTIFYIVDNSTDSTRDFNELDNPNLWIYILDRFIFKQITGDRHQLDQICSHVSVQIPALYDPITRKVLDIERIKTNDIFDLFGYMCLNFHDMDVHYDVGTMYNKELSVVRNLLSNIVYAVFISVYRLEKLPLETLSVEKIEKLLSKTLSRNHILHTSGHGELTPASIASDCRPFSATCNMISHNKASVSSKGDKNKSSVIDNSDLLHPSQVEVATYSWISASSPYGRDKINPFVFLSGGSYIKARPQLKPVIDGLRKLLPKRV